MKRYLVPVVAGVTVFGAATAFAASLTVTSQSLGSGNGSVASCNATATVAYSGTTYSVSPYGYKVGTVPVTSAVACATKSYKLTLTGAANASLAEKTGVLDASGNVSPDFTADNILASLVTGASLVITG